MKKRQFYKIYGGKMKKSVLAIMVGALCIILSSCQETPEESSVVSKVDGISEAAVCEPLKKGEKRETNVPTHWKFEEKPFPLEVLSIIALELKFHFPEVWLPVRQQKYGSVQFL